MDFEKYTERSRGFVQAAQTLALRRGHQRLTPEHLLKTLLDDKEGLAANLIRAAGGDPALALSGVDAELDKQPKVEGAGAACHTGERSCFYRAVPLDKAATPELRMKRI